MQGGWPHASGGVLDVREECTEGVYRSAMHSSVTKGARDAEDALHLWLVYWSCPLYGWLQDRAWNSRTPGLVWTTPEYFLAGWGRHPGIRGACTPSCSDRCTRVPGLLPVHRGASVTVSVRHLAECLQV